MNDELPPLPEPAARVQQYELPGHIDGYLVACSEGHELSDYERLYTADQVEGIRRAAVLAERERWQGRKLWLWQNFVDGRREYWAFDNPYPVHGDHGDPQTLGEPCGYALFKPSRNGRPEVPDSKVLAAIQRVWGADAIRAEGKPPCCKGGPQWGHAWDCPECPD